MNEPNFCQQMLFKVYPNKELMCAVGEAVKWNITKNDNKIAVDGDTLFANLLNVKFIFHQKINKCHCEWGDIKFRGDLNFLKAFFYGFLNACRTLRDFF